jgi:type I restriction enzyme S subunit
MTTYKRLGDYIREVNVRNRNLKVTKLVGLTIDKAFIPSVANVIGTDLSNYKVIQREQFACSLMQVSRDGKMPVAMFEEDEAIMSPAYPMFEVIDKTVLMPQYLMMWFSRSEFDREASYYAVGGVRGSLTWEDFCNMRLPIPSITRQREIVSEYETLTNRIRLNNQMIQHLEATAQALYRKTFVDNIDKESLPEGWRMGTLGEVCSKIGSGATPKGGKDSYGHTGVSLIRSMNVFDMNFCYEELAHISNKQATLLDGVTVMKKDILLNITGASVARCCMVPQDVLPARVNQHVMIIRSKEDIMQYFILCVLCSDDAKRALLGMSQSGSTREAITKLEIESFEIMIPSKDILNDFMSKIDPIFSHVSLLKQENLNLTELQSLLLSKMGQ